MFIRRVYFCLAVGVASIGYNAAANAIEVTEIKENSAKEAVFVSIQNLSNSPIFLNFSNGISVELKEKTGKLLPCSEVAGKALSFGKKLDASDFSKNIECGYSYDVKEGVQ